MNYITWIFGLGVKKYLLSKAKVFYEPRLQLPKNFRCQWATFKFSKVSYGFFPPVWIRSKLMWEALNLLLQIPLNLLLLFKLFSDAFWDFLFVPSESLELKLTDSSKCMIKQNTLEYLEAAWMWSVGGHVWRYETQLDAMSDLLWHSQSLMTPRRWKDWLLIHLQPTLVFCLLPCEWTKDWGK